MTKNQSHYLLFFLLALLLAGVLAANGQTPSNSTKLTKFNRTSFPPDFIFGAGSSAYQYEGAAYEDGKGPSLWDAFVKKYPERIIDGSNGDVALDFYHRYKEDIKLMKKIGLDSFRFSISWSRILPKGNLSGGVNPLGVQFYNNLINELLANGIKPFVTLFHFDPPLALEDEYGGFLSPKIVNDFVDYVDFCFKSFGDRVKHWVTMNEPNLWSMTMMAQNGTSLTPVNASTGLYILGHHLLLSHAAAVKLYWDKYKSSQKGEIGITILAYWYIPKYNTTSDINAASRALDFFFGWFLDPVTFGKYPDTMRTLVGSRLPNFTEAESKLLTGSFDFLGVNYYTSNFAEDGPPSNETVTPTFGLGDSRVNLSTERDGVAIGIPTDSRTLFIYPKGLQDLVLLIKDKYKNPPIYITENGIAESRNDSKPVKEAIKDGLRIRALSGHLKALSNAIREGVNVKAYYMWSFMDDFEWTSGYTRRFGFVYIDYMNNLGRVLKYSAYWFKMFLLK